MSAGRLYITKEYFVKEQISIFGLFAMNAGEGSEYALAGTKCPFSFLRLSKIMRRVKLMRSEAEIRKKLRELERANLDEMVFDEVEYGKYWLEWVLEKHEHTTKTR